MEEIKESQDLTKIFENLFSPSSPLAGEEELLRIGTQYTAQLNTNQIKGLLLLEIGKEITEDQKAKKILENFINSYLKFKKYHGTDKFIVKLFEYISLKKFLGENWLKVNIEK